MSIDGDFACCSADRLDEIRARPTEAFDLVVMGRLDGGIHLDIDGYMSRLGRFYPLLAAFFADAADRGFGSIFRTA
ncbi:hypothetical protein KOI35_10750 [Actinoplanes bogorensis]|uniref:Barstar (barnase inhibitor) domain-containing protein n=1 Tax=Paractinoplanes bogorensis TaxID=1610840 RepID=A0ABS5YKL9_9ACTN|nr:hypothetical protein [Actinoplanes bogorensis]MBU2663967.1 hypothetical protein [Actinoplanes bogorensis]